jgi:hypothetical protein
MALIFNLEGLTVEDYHALLTDTVTNKTGVWVKAIQEWDLEKPINAENLLDLDYDEEWQPIVTALFSALQDKIKAVEPKSGVNWDLTRLTVKAFEELNNINAMRPDFIERARAMVARWKNPDNKKPLEQWLYFAEFLPLSRSFGSAMAERQKKLRS